MLVTHVSVALNTTVISIRSKVGGANRNKLLNFFGALHTARAHPKIMENEKEPGKALEEDIW